MAAIEIVSFGFLHAAPPAADRLVDLRPFRDPHAAKHLRHLTALDAPVRAAVLATPGIADVIREAAAWASTQAGGTRTVTIAVGCQGGRHRAPTAAREIASRLIAAQHAVIVTHRDLHRPVIQR